MTTTPDPTPVHTDGCMGNEHSPGSNPACDFAPAVPVDAPEPTHEELAALVAPELQGGVRNMRARAVDCEVNAANFEESARRERVLAEDFRAKANALSVLLPLIGVEAPVDAEENSDFPRPVV